MPTSNDSGVLQAGSPADLSLFSQALHGQLARPNGHKRSSRFTIIIDDPCYAPEESFRTVLSAISECTRGDAPEACIRGVLSEHLADQDLDELKIFTQGKHVVTSGFAVACGTAQVEVNGRGVLFACGRATIVARGQFEVYATDDVRISAYGDVNIDASGRVKIINSFDRVTGTARDKVEGVARGQSQWIVTDSVLFDGHDNATINGEDNAILRAYGSCRLRGKGKVKATLFDRSQGWFVDGAEVDLFGNAICYAQEPVTVRKKSLNARIFRYPASDRLDCFAWALEGAQSTGSCA